MKFYRNCKFSFLFVLIFLGMEVNAYPIDGYLRTGIRRLLRLERIQSGEIKENLPPKGALLPLDSIQLSLLGHDFNAFPKTDGELQKKIDRLFPNLDQSYSITVLDITNTDNIRYAVRKETRGFQPGSVGKLAVVTALFCELENLYPDDFEKRIELLKSKQVRAGYWAVPNIHTVPFFNPETNKLNKRILVENDVFSLFEWVDHMLSVSSNGAASVVWREVMLMRQFGDKYSDLTEATAEEYFNTTSKKELSDLSVEIVNAPLRELGITEDEWRLGTFFTRGASNKIPPQGGSIGSPLGLTKWLWAMEHGKIVDEASSLEIKRLMYMTDRRIRYASNAKLNNAAVFYKSGSLYKCKKEEGYECGQYKGNEYNYMNSVAIIEHPDGKKYMAVLMTNVLKKNSNIDHSELGGRIDEVIRSL